MVRKSMVKLIVLFVVVGGFYVYAQESPKSKDFYSSNALYFESTFWTGENVVQGFTKYKVTMFGGSEQMVALISQSPLAAMEMIEYKRKNSIGWGLYWGGLGVSLVGATLPFIFMGNQDILMVSLGVDLVGLVIALAGIIPVSNSYNYLHKAIWEYNKYILYDE